LNAASSSITGSSPLIAALQQIPWDDSGMLSTLRPTSTTSDVGIGLIE
jgi:hypothetical protein